MNEESPALQTHYLLISSKQILISLRTAKEENFSPHRGAWMEISFLATAH